MFVLAVIAALVLGGAGFREFKARQPIDRDSLIVPADFPGAVHALEQLSRSRARPLLVRDLAGQLDTTPGFYVTVREARALALLDSTIRRQFRDEGFYLFWWHRRHGRRAYNRVGLYPSMDQFAVVRAMQTGAPDVRTDSIVSWFQSVEREHPLKLTTIGPNTLEGRIAVDSAAATDLAVRFSEFCPDLEREGSVTTARRAESMRRSGYFKCWWKGGAR